MLTDAEHDSRERVVSGTTFDNVPYQIALSDTAFSHGSSAKIYKGRMLSGDPLVVSVKVFGGMLDPVKQQLLVRELRFAREVSLCHPLILAFLGTAVVGEQTAIVSLYMGNGNLIEYLKRNPGCDKKSLILQVAVALDYLHGTARLVHGDIKCANVLVSDFGDALLADFGLSTMAEKSQSASATMTAIRAMNTVQFAAPELLLGEGDTTLSKTCESDVYAFGMLIVEAVSEQPPWGMKSTVAVVQAVCSRKHPAQPTQHGGFVSISHTWWNTCLSCWSFDPTDRPSINAVLNSLKTAELAPSEQSPAPSYRRFRFRESVTSAVYMPDGQTIVAGSVDGVILVFDTVTGYIRRLWHGDPGYAIDIAVSPNGQQIASDALAEILLWDVASWAVTTSLRRTTGNECAPCYSPDGMRLAFDVGTQIYLWDLAAGPAAAHPIGGHGGSIVGLAFSPDSTRIASGSDDGTIRVWDVAKGALLVDLELPDVGDMVHSICLAPDGIHLLSGSSSGDIMIWDLSTGKFVREHTHSDPVWCLAFSPSGMYIASGWNDGIRIYDARTGRALGRTFSGHDAFVRNLNFSPDGRRLVSSSSDNTICVWEVDEWIKRMAS